MAIEPIVSTEDSALGGNNSQATVGSDLTVSLDVRVESLLVREQTTSDTPRAALTIQATDPTVSLDVAVQSLQHRDQSTTDTPRAALTIQATDPTVSLDVAVQSLQHRDQSITDTPKAALTVHTTDPTASLQPNIQSLQLWSQTLADGSDTVITVHAAEPTVSLSVSIGSLLALAQTTSDGGDTSITVSIADPTVGLSVNVSILGLESTEDAVVGSDSQATVGADLTASLDVRVDSLIGAGQSLTDTPSAALTVGTTDPIVTLQPNIQSLQHWGQTTSETPDAALTVTAADLTASLQPNIQSLQLWSQTLADGSDTIITVHAAEPTVALDVLKDSMSALVQSTTDTPDAALTVHASDPTVSLQVNIQSLQHWGQTTSETPDAALTVTAADPTATLDVAVQSLQLYGQTIADGSDTAITITATDPTVSLEVLVARLGIESTTPGVVDGQAALSISIPLDTQEDGKVDGSAILVPSTFLTCDLDMVVAQTFTSTASLSVEIQGTETVTTDLEMVIAAITEVSTSLSVEIQGTETRTVDLDLVVQTTETRTVDLDQAVAATITPTADLDQLVKAIQFRYAYPDVSVSPTRAFRHDLNLLVKGEFTRTVDLSMALQGTVSLTPSLDMFIERRLPFSLMKLWGNVTTRYLGGTASDANFFEHFEPHPAAVINNDIGAISPGDRRVTFSTPNTIPTPAGYDKYSIPLAVPRLVGTVGFRTLFCFELRAFGPSNMLLFGGFTGTNDPITDIANQDFIGMSIEADKGTVQFRAWAAGNESSRSFALGLPVDRFLDVPLLIEIETVSATAGLTDLEFRLFDRSVDLTAPLVTIPLETSVPPTITHVAMTSLGRRTPELSTAQPNMHVELTYLDVEYGAGATYQPEYTGLADAKLRDYQDRPPIELSQDGVDLLTDNLGTDQGYWVLDTSVPTTLSFTGNEALIEGNVSANPAGSVGWTDYQATVQVNPGAPVVGPDGVTIGIYSSGTSATGDGFLFTIAYLINTWYVIKLVGGAPTTVATGTYQFGTFDPTDWHTLTLNSQTDSVGNTALHAFVDGNPVSQVVTDTVLSGTVTLGSNLASPVAFRNLNARAGVNDVFVALADAPTPLSDTVHQSVTVDSSDPIITVTAFDPQSSVLVPNTFTPPVVKGSLNSGYSIVQMKWYATHPGTWTLRVDSTGATNGLELRSGTYQRAYEEVVTGWNFSELPQVDGTYDVTLYLIADSGKATAKKLGEYLLP